MTHLTNTPDRLSDYLPDPRRPAIPDMLTRNLFLRSSLITTHTTLATNDTMTTRASELLRIREVRVGAVSGGTVTVQVYVNNVPVFNNPLRPVSGGVTRQPHSRDRWIIGGGSVVKTVIEVTSGAPTGNANVVIDTEPFVLVSIIPELKLKGKSRLFVDRRRAVRAYNEVGVADAVAVALRSQGIIGSAKRTQTQAKGQGAGGASGADIIIDPDPIKPGPIKPPKPGGGGGGDLPPIKPPTF